VVARQTEMISVDYQDTRIDLAVTLRPRTDDLVLFLHGFGCAKESFEQAFRIADLDAFSLCAFDFPGHGQSSRVPSSLYALQSYAEVTNILIDRIRPRRVFLVGHSMGGAVALIATQGRQDIACLISVDGNLVADDCGIVSRSTATQPLTDFVNSGYLSFAQKLQTSAHRDEIAWGRWYNHADPLALHESASSLVEWSDNGKLMELYSSLARKSYVYGDREVKDYLLPLLDNNTIHRIENAGHFVMIDNPDAFYHELSMILRDVQSGPPGTMSSYPASQVDSPAATGPLQADLSRLAGR
jgi:pimeloyl-ACP methyl ester carboxylesterase